MKLSLLHTINTKWHCILQYLMTFSFTLIITIASMGQNVGIGVDNPVHKLQVDGVVYASTQIRTNGWGYFGERVQIGPGGSYQMNYQLHVAGDTYMQNLAIGHYGSIGSNKLYVDGSAKFNGALQLDGSLSGVASLSSYNIMNSNVATTNFLHVETDAFIDNDGIVGGNFRVNGRVGINGATNASYGLMVNNANSYFQGHTTTSGNATVNGTLNAAGNLTIKGNGHVRSQGPSNLQVGFKSKAFNEAFGANQVKEYTVTLDDFDGGNNDIRVMVSQFDPDPAAAYQNWRYFSFHIYDIDALANTCRLVVYNGSGVVSTLKGVMYLTTVSKE